MPQVLYRQYRPQKFSEVVNQEVVKTTLKNSVQSGALAHAYLFTGPRGVGKTSVARILAKAVNCQRNNLSPVPPGRDGTLPSKGESKAVGAAPRNLGEPCGECAHCQQITAGNFMDLIEIDAASHTGVDNIREIIEHVKFAPGAGKYKIIVIDEVHMLSRGAFNALLKTLEEPPQHAIFVLATTEISKVPATIISRTQRYDFKQLSAADILGQLKMVAKANKFSISEEVLKLAARAASGSMRDGLSLLDQLVSFSGGKITLEQAEEILGMAPFSLNQDFFQLLLARQSAQALIFIKNLVLKGRDLTQFSHGFLEYIDLILNFKIRAGEKHDWGLVEEDMQRLTEQAQKISQTDLLRLAELVLAAVQKIRYSPLPELPLELAAIKFANQAENSEKSVNPPSESPKPVKEQHPEQSAAPQGHDSGGALYAAAISGDEILEKWNIFMAKLRDYNHSLIASLKLASIASFDGKRLKLAFPYRFHKDAVEQRKNKIVIEKVLEDVYGRTIKLDCCLTHEVDEVLGQHEPREKSSLLDEAVKIFGISKSQS